MNAHTSPIKPSDRLTERDEDEAHEAARTAAFLEFIDWQRADYDRREFEDFGNWLANKARWNRPNAYEAALTWAERLSDADLVAHSKNHKQFNRQERRAGGRA